MNEDCNTLGGCSNESFVEESVEGSGQKLRFQLHPDQESVLFEYYFSNGLPSTEEKRRLATQLNISLKHLSAWFYNRLCRKVPQPFTGLSELQVTRLKKVFEKTPRLSIDEIRALSKETQVPNRKLRLWFSQQRSALNSGTKKKLRATSQQTSALNEVYKVDKTPSMSKRREISANINLPLEYVSRWFVKKRKKATCDRGRYGRYTRLQIKHLQQVFNECPNPTIDRRRELAKELGLSLDQVYSWFRNNRVRRNIPGVYTGPSLLLDENQRNSLKEIFAVDPCPDRIKRIAIARRFDLPYKKIRSWFQLQRNKQGTLTKHFNRFSEKQKQLLEQAYSMNQCLSIQAKKELAVKLGLSAKQVTSWFRTKRVTLGLAGHGSNVNTKLTESQHDRLHEAFLKDPIPTVFSRQELANKCSLSFERVCNFFSRRRCVYYLQNVKHRFSVENLSILNQAFRMNKSPTREEYERLAVETGVTVANIRQWFTNRQSSSRKID